MAGNHHFSRQVCTARVDQDPSHTYHFQRTPTTASTPAAVPLVSPGSPLPRPITMLLLPQTGRVHFLQLVPELQWQTDLLWRLTVPLSCPCIAPILPLQTSVMITEPKARNADYAVNPGSRGVLAMQSHSAWGSFSPCSAASGTILVVSDGKNICHG